MSSAESDEPAADLWQSPGDLSVVGFDDIPLTALTDPPLTTAHQPPAEMAVADPPRGAAREAVSPRRAR